MGALLVAACGGDDLESRIAGAAGRLTAVESGNPFEMPDVALTATDGSSYDLRTETAGRFALVFYGYTYCPDICPITMSVSNAALAELTPDERARVVSIFISMDPLRDTPERIGEWLSAMGSSAVGLRGSTMEVERALNGMGMAMPPTTSNERIQGATEDDYLVPHPASLFLVTPDGLGRFVYGFDRVTPEQMAADLRVLMEIDWPAPAASAGTAQSGAPASVEVTAVRIPAPTGPERAAVYADIRGGAAGDRLVGLSAEVAVDGSLHEMRTDGGMMTMSPVEAIEIPAGGSIELKPGELHGMLEGLTAVPTVGDTVAVTFEFASGALLTVPALVIDPVDAIGG